MRVRLFPAALLLLVAGSAAAQRPIFSPDTFVDPLMLDTTIISSQRASERRRGLDQSITFDTDTHFSSHGINIWGTAYVAHAWSSGMPAGDRAQNEVGYTYRVPAFPVGPLFVLGKVT